MLAFFWTSKFIMFQQHFVYSNYVATMIKSYLIDRLLMWANYSRLGCEEEDRLLIRRRDCVGQRASFRLSGVVHSILARNHICYSVYDKNRPLPLIFLLIYSVSDIQTMTTYNLEALIRSHLDKENIESIITRVIISK